MGDTLIKEFGATIRFYRTKNGLSQEKLGERCGFHRTYIGQVERGERNPTLKSIAIFASVFNVSLSELFQKCEQLKKLLS
jgi:transcriptional regulator with XRE-family HTH domain